MLVSPSHLHIARERTNTGRLLLNLQIRSGHIEKKLPHLDFVVGRSNSCSARFGTACWPGWLRFSWMWLLPHHREQVLPLPREEQREAGLRRTGGNHLAHGRLAKSSCSCSTSRARRGEKLDGHAARSKTEQHDVLLQLPTSRRHRRSPRWKLSFFRSSHP
jgi:hypothetical protein